MHKFLSCFLIALVVSAAPAHADFERSRLWFEGLAEDQRSAVQADLVLLAHYGGLVDAEFGPATYRAVVAFQESLSTAPTGELTDFQVEILSGTANGVAIAFGIELVREERAGLAVAVPTGLLTVSRPTENGTLFEDAEGNFTLEVFGVPDGDTSFAGMFEYAVRTAPGRRVTYSVMRDDAYVVSGVDGDRYFYELGLPLPGQTSGFRYHYAENDRYVGGIVSVYSASYVAPLALLEDEVSTPPAVSEQLDLAFERFGVFLAPAELPDALILDGEIVASTPLDLRRALKHRPGTKRLLLNSPGGSVYSALLLAHDVHALGLAAEVPEGFGCYSACAYVFFGGMPRKLDGELGVHQISSDVQDLASAQVAISDILDALSEFGVSQDVVSLMLRTSPDSMHVFTKEEVARLRIEVGNPPADEEAAYVVLGVLDTKARAQATADALVERFSVLLRTDDVEVLRTETSPSVFRFRVVAPQPTVSSAHELCARIKAAGGGCFTSGD